MKKTKSEFSRRDFLKSAGAAAGLALPFLNSEVAMGQTTVAPTRLLLVPLQHGWGFNRSQKDITGTSEFNFTLPAFAQAAFNPIRNQMVFVDGLRTDVWGNAHDRNYSNLLTCSTRYVGQTGDSSSNAALGGPFPNPTRPSLDFLISRAVNKPVLRFSRRYQSWGASFHPLCFDDSLRNQPFYTTALQAYMAIIDPLRQTQTTVNPAVRAGDNALFNILGRNTDNLLRMLTGSERTKMENYLNAMNALGTRVLSTSSSGGTGNVTLPPQPGQNLTYNDELESYLDMIRVAFQMDTHRVAVLGLGENTNDWTWTDSAGVARMGNTFGGDFHHQVAHHSSEDSRLAFEGYTQWYGRRIAAFAQRLAGIPDVDGRSLLENTMIVLLGEVGDGHHETRHVVVPIIGGGGGRIVRNRWIRIPMAVNNGGTMWRERDVAGNLVSFTDNWGSAVSTRHIADLWVSVARLAGLNINTFGEDVHNVAPISLTA